MHEHQIPSEYVETLVIGGGQAGLAVGYHLAERGVDHVILNDEARVGDSWRRRWGFLLEVTMDLSVHHLHQCH